MTKPKKSKNKYLQAPGTPTTAALGFDDHQAFSEDEVKAVLRFFNLPERDYWEWMYGHTCPMLPNGKIGVYWYDLHRYVQWKEKGVLPVFD